MRISDWSSDVCASDLEPVAEEAEQHRPQGPEAETDREARPDEQDFERRIDAGEKGLADDRRQRAVDEEIIPFEDRARRRSGDEHANVFRARLLNHGFATKPYPPPTAVRPDLVYRSQEPHVGQECVSTCRSRMSPNQ